jgi:hypothetical protein
MRCEPGTTRRASKPLASSGLIASRSSSLFRSPSGNCVKQGGRGYVEAFLALTFPLFSSLASGVELGPGAGSR